MLWQVGGGRGWVPREGAHRVMSSSGMTGSILGTQQGLMLPKSQKIVCGKPCGIFFFPS